MNLDRLTEMAVFAAVVDEGSFTGAARALDQSKAVVSKRVASLENALGLRLLNRSTRRLSMTEAGEALYARCRTILDEAEQAEATLRPLAEAPRGLLRLDVPASFGVRQIAPLLPAFMHRYPEISIDLTLNDQMINLVESAIDLAIRIGELDDSSLVSRRLAPSRRYLCASPDYLRRRTLPEDPRDLRDHHCLLYRYQASGERWKFRNAKGERRQVTVSGRLRANHGEALLQACEAGLGIGLLPSFMAGTALRQGRLLPILCDWQDEADTAVHAVYPAARNLSPKVRVFIDFLAARFGGRPFWEEGLP
ncbi:LysR family transcriptional regulator [Limibacillus sp. MBR-115]|jgi:DNA-binding transcriptional LysR family regulator|uniref:LysR family transcriptional regulator n=1 Tax=Limibacillus sp. MBR-115 TaxID=3156465 RepID=UPI003397F523